MDWARMLAYATGTVDQELLARNEYLAAENRTIKAQLTGRLKLTDAERGALGEIGHRLGRRVLADVATVARPETILEGGPAEAAADELHPVRQFVQQRVSRQNEAHQPPRSSASQDVGEGRV
ncbi:hypothetical protein SAMN02990966_01830 [Rhodospirillales bacterium URHD0017]|nr:hypothetical protein SAMN02990966_01830 [Rhodospirillales bacterium URHD0017]